MEYYVYTGNLESERLITRMLTESDAEIWTRFFEDKEATEFIPDLGFNAAKDKAQYWIERQINRYETQRFGLQAIINKKTNEFIGQCGLLKQEADGITEIEVGYHFLKKYWGQGFAPEAAKLFINFAFNELELDSVISIIDVNNLKSQRVAEKNGLIRDKETRWSDLSVYIYRIKKPKAQTST